MVAAHTHPAGAGAQVVDSVGDRLADLGIGEVVHQHLLRLAGRLPLDPTVGVVADQLLFLVSTLTTGRPWSSRARAVSLM